MTASIPFDEISVLIPGYSIEDLPTDLGESAANSLLNALAVAWHPRLLRLSRGIPCARQAETAGDLPGRRVLLVPSCAEDWMPHEWQQALAARGLDVIDRGNLLELQAVVREMGDDFKRFALRDLTIYPVGPEIWKALRARRAEVEEAQRKTQFNQSEAK